MTEQEFVVHPTNERPQRFKGTRIGQIDITIDENMRQSRQFFIYKRPTGNFYLEQVDTDGMLNDKKTQLHKDLSEEEAMDEIGWSREAVALYEKLGWEHVEDND